MQESFKGQSVKQEMLWANVNAGTFWTSVIFQPKNASVIQHMLYHRTNASKCFWAKCQKMQEPKCSGQGGRASEHWQWGKYGGKPQSKL